MKDYRVTLNEYIDYLHTLRDSIFKILPLYEEKNRYLHTYIDKTIDEVIYVKEIIKELPHGNWYVVTLDSLLMLADKVNESNHEVVKRIVFNAMNLIGKEIKEAIKDIENEKG